MAKQNYLAYVALYPEDCYFTYIALRDGTCHLANSDYYYSKDLGSNWVHVTSASTEINVANGDIVLFKGTIMPQPYAGIGHFYSTASYEVAGNIMSFIYGDNFRGHTSFPSEMPDFGGFVSLFGNPNANNFTLMSAKNLILPVSVVDKGVYVNMFRKCIYLIESPIISASSINDSASYMFANCSNLRYINTKFKQISLGGIYDWVEGVDSKGIFIKNIAANWDISGTSGVPEGWQIQYTYDNNLE